MDGEGAVGGWRKAIPEGRDQVQSRVLVWVMAPLLVVLTAQTIDLSLYRNTSWRSHTIEVLAISLIFGAVVLGLRAATRMAAACGVMICLLLTFWTGSFIQSPLRSALTPLLILFVLTFAATRAGRKRKTERGLAESRKGRSAAQVIANLGVAALCSSLWGDQAVRWIGHNRRGPSPDTYWVLCIFILAALAEATADTVSSEIGQAFGGAPFMLTTLRRVPPGTDGAITFIGTLAGIACAAIIAATGSLAMRMSGAQCIIAFGAGVAGLFFDSLLGATVERKGWLGNDLVNFFSTAFAAGVSLVIIRFAQDALLR
jgi:uncharacterized protein (TIGR00297 family)